jgi:hypothetical protein
MWTPDLQCSERESHQKNGFHLDDLGLRGLWGNFTLFVDLFKDELPASHLYALMVDWKLNDEYEIV